MSESSNIFMESVDTRYGRMKYIAADAPIGRAVAEYGEWAELEIQLLSSFITPGSSVVDVGANIGTHTLAFARQVGSEGHVLAFEPQQAVFTILEHNIEANELTHVRAVLAGVGAVAGEMLVRGIDYNKRANIGALRLEPIGDDSDGSRIPVVSIDDLHLLTCRLVKIDAEGMDASVVAGMAETIENLRPVVAVECNDVDSGAAVLRANKWLNYKVFLSRTAAFNPDNFRQNDDNIFGVAYESSLLFVPNEYLDFVPEGRPGIELIAVCDLASLAVAVIETPRYGDETVHDRKPAHLRAKIRKITEEKEHLSEDLRKMKEFAQTADERNGRPDSVFTESADEGAGGRGEATPPVNIDGDDPMTGTSYITRYFHSIDGSVSECAVYATELFMGAQRDLGIQGVNLEIGVWQGKYLGAIIATCPDRLAYGIDVWLHDQSGQVATFLANVSPGTRVKLLRANSFLYEPDTLRFAIDKNSVAFASIDGSCEAVSVERDVTNVSRLLSPGGIMAIANFLNPMTLGVIEGVLAFLKGGTLIEPVCWIEDKIFLTTPGWGNLYQSRLRMCFDQGGLQAPVGMDVINQRLHTTSLLGRPVLAVS